MKRFFLKSLSFRSKLSMLLYSVSLCSVLIVGFYGYQHASHAYRSRATDLVEGYTSEVAVKIQSFLSLARNDLQFFNQLYALRHYAYWRDIGDEKQMAYWQAITTDALRNFNNVYDYSFKIYFLDNQGLELLGVRHDTTDGMIHTLTENELTNHAGTDYVLATQKLNKGSDIYVSPLDLNREQGVISRPLIPVVRFATPMIADNGVRYGMIVYHVLANKFFEFIRIANKNSQGRVFYLIDQQGQFLYHADNDKMLGKLLGHEASFEQDYPSVLAKMLANRAGGIINTETEIIAYRPIYPDMNNHDNFWLLVGVTAEKTALSELDNFIHLFALLFAAVATLVLMANRYMLAQMTQPLLFVTRQLQRLSLGVARTDNLAYQADDEIRQMLDSCNRVVANIHSLTRQVDAIANGNFDESVEPLSDDDHLSRAINNMTTMLRLSRHSDELRNWHNEGLNELSKLMTNTNTPQALADAAISELGRYLKAGRGVFYIWNGLDENLQLLGSFMHHEREHLGAIVQLGEGAIGQVAREKKPIILHLEAAVSSETLPIVTGTQNKQPHYTYTMPLLREGELHGVLEIATLEHLSEGQTLYLYAASEIVANFLYTSQQKNRIQGLLMIAEQSAAESQAHARVLQEVNARMEEQQQQLQQQTEELQQANAQMEEQQQQLQQQTEELQQTNAQMEEAQQQMEQQNHRLRESQQELDTRAKQLELSSQYKSEFLANMSHELRTPLNSIILLSKMMASNSDKHLSDEEVHHADIIHNAGQELLRLINDVLDLSKIEAGRMELHVGTVTSQELLAEMRELFSNSAEEKNLAFILEDKLRGEFVSDVNRLSQILRNLLSNAFKFTKTGGITLSIGRGNNTQYPIRISVQDTGIGIPEEKRKVIFEAFQQADGSISRQYGGTGLGLSISLRFAKLLGGTIELNSTEGQGSEFVLLLPETLAGTETAPLTPATTSVPAINSKPINDDREQLSTQDSVILLIDDDLLFGQALLEINRKLGYKTLLAVTGNEGLTLAQRYRPNGILLDLGLPDMDGSEVLHRIKTQAELVNIPVYVVSGREKDAALEQEGLLGYLQKPVDAQQISKAETELLACIRQTAALTIVVVENGSIKTEQVRELLGNQVATVLKADFSTDMNTLLKQHPCCLAVIDLAEKNTQAALEMAKKLRQIDAHINFVFFGQSTLSDEEEAKLRNYSDSVIIKTPQSEQRLLKNIERFLNKAISRTGSSAAVNVKETDANGKRLMGRHILVVDDDARNLFVITSALEKEGAKVSGALNGKRALEFLQQQMVDLIFMDIMMPEMDGYQAITALRADPALANVPIVVLTAKALSVDKAKAAAVGADDYLSKPVDYDALINMATVWCTGRH